MSKYIEVKEHLETDENIKLIAIAMIGRIQTTTYGYEILDYTGKEIATAHRKPDKIIEEYEQLRDILVNL